MEIRETDEKALSLPNMRMFQRICIGISVLLVFFFLRCFMSNVGNYNMLLLLIIAIGLLVIVNFLYIQLKEVYVGKDEIIIKSFFKRACIERSEFRTVAAVFMLPFIYKISFRNGRRYYFMINPALMIKEIVKLDNFDVIDKLNENIKKGGGIFLFVLVVFGVFSCKERNDKGGLVQYRDGQQLLTMNGMRRNGQKFVTPGIAMVSNDSVLVGNELLVKIFLESDELKLVDAFVDCKSVSDPAVDTSTYRVLGCSNRLFVQNDTVFIGFRAGKPGVQRFPDITLLTRDPEKIFRTFKYSFEYKVVGGS